MKNWLIFLFACLALSHLACEKPDPPPQIYQETAWQFNYGGADNELARAGVFAGGQLYALGTSRSFENPNGAIYLLRIDTSGLQTGQYEFGFDAPYEGHDIILSADGQLLILGSRQDPATGNKDLYIVNCDLNGNELWSKRIETEGSERPREMLLLANGNLVVCGAVEREDSGDRDIHLTWLSAEGDLIQHRYFGGAAYDGAQNILEIEDQELMLSGYTDSYGAGDRDLYLMKLSAQGDSIWSETYGGEGYEEPGSFARTLEGGYITVAHTASTEPNHNMTALRLDDRGVVVWQQEFGGSEHDGGQAVYVKPGGGFVFIGRTNSRGAGLQDILMADVDDYGTSSLERSFGGADTDRADDILAFGNYYYIIGQSRSYNFGDNDVFIIKHEID